MATLKEPKSLLDTAYLTKGTIGNVGMPGAPIAHFSLVVSPEQGTVSGIVEITQAIDRPTIKVNVAGRLRHTGYGNITQIVSLDGEYVVTVPPPAIGSYLEKFNAYLDVDNSWNGTGGFSFGFQKVENVPVTSANK
ncbi:DUF1842 domain-containing protein [uncultured Tenacibaculum sp.]|uniref:DUF1842 domain-containing protein n=1 Tax=uncultured Tenacibaculum sp. TaxID=174713 RepID=UPI002634F55F|nr:DUF1842 domain-containing protein [uncultured Tenacibaculum sp.]